MKLKAVQYSENSSITSRDQTHVSKECILTKNLCTRNPVCASSHQETRHTHVIKGRTKSLGTNEKFCSELQNLNCPLFLRCSWIEDLHRKQQTAIFRKVLMNTFCLLLYLCHTI